MAADTREKDFLYVGIDAGGTKTEVRVASSRSDREVALHGTGANLQRAGFAASAKVLADLILQATAAFPLDDRISICAGVAGAGDPASQHRLRVEIQAQLERSGVGERLGALQVVEDGQVALEAALGDASGGVMIVGTGSVVLGRTNEGRVLSVGGWGYLLGDQGSGHAIGLAGLKLAVAAFEGRPMGAVPDRVRRQFSIHSRADLIHRVYRAQWALQEVAPLVIEAAASGDSHALEILEAEAEDLIGQVAWMVHQAGSAIEPQLVMLGGLSRETFYREMLERILEARCPAWRVVPPVHQKPVAGAVSLARKAALEIVDG